MAFFGSKQPKKDPPAAPSPASRSTVKVAPKGQRATTAVVPKSGVGNQSVSKSVRLRNAQDRIHQMKNSAALRAGVKRAMPSQRVAPRAPAATPAAATPGRDTSSQRSLAEVITTERKVRTSTPNKRLGQLLVKAGKITENQLAAAVKEHDKTGHLLGQILVEQGACTSNDIAIVLKQQRTITTVNLNATTFDPAAVALLDRAFCEKHKVVPFELCNDQLCVAMSNALDTTTKTEIKEKTGKHVKIFDASNPDIQNAIKRYYGAQAVAAPKPSIQDEAKKEEMVDDVDLVIELPGEQPGAAQPAPAKPATPAPAPKAPAPAAPAPATTPAPKAAPAKPAPAKPAAPAAPAAPAPAAAAAKPAPAAKPEAQAKPAPAPAPQPVAEEEEELILEEEEDTAIPLIVEETPEAAAAPAPVAEPELEVIDEAEEKPAAAVVPEPEIVVDAEPPAPAQGGDMPSISENLEDMDISEIATPASIFARPPQPGALAAIPVSNAYAAAIVENGFLSPEKRWLLAIRATQPVPAVPLLYKVG